MRSLPLRHLAPFCVLVPFGATTAADAANPGDRDQTHRLERFFDHAISGREERRIPGDSVEFHPGDDSYPASLAQSGAQGSVLLLVDVAADGSVKHARVHESSRSPELDELAIGKALTMSYRGNGAPPAVASLRVEFLRDTVDSLQSKSCAELNVDAAWFRKSFPERPETDLSSIVMIGNLFQLANGMRDHAERVPLMNALPFALCSIVNACTANPTALVNHVFGEAMRANLEHPESRGAMCAFSRPVSHETLPRSLLRSYVDTPVHFPSQYITPDLSAYPAQLAAKGIQGVVHIEVSVTSEGAITAITPSSSHHEAGLTDAAVAYARTLPFKDAARPEVPASTIEVDIHFEKDTMATLVGKTCADFNIDDAARKATVPVPSLMSMHVFAVARDLIVSHAFSNSLAGAVPGPEDDPAIKRALLPELGLPDDDPAIKLATVERCLGQPDLLFFEVLQQEMLSAQKTKHPAH